MTKAMVAAGTGQLVEDGRMNWTTPVMDILPELNYSNPYMNDLMTVIDLMAHRIDLSPFCRRPVRATGICFSHRRR
jgi:CubicO group peptidase (beta-lactamase class C family)